VYGYDAQQGKAYDQRLAALQQRSAKLMDILSPGTGAPGAR
jgi:hypothetical protein